APSDRGEFCADVAGLRACWGATDQGANCASGVCVADRPLPSVPSADRGWRCHGQRDRRRCVERGRGASRFVCDGAACTQAYPRALVGRAVCSPTCTEPRLLARPRLLSGPIVSVGNVHGERLMTRSRAPVAAAFACSILAGGLACRTGSPPAQPAYVIVHADP